MMDFIISQQIAKARYEEMLEDAAEARRANAFRKAQKNGLGVLGVLNNVIAELRFHPRNARRATTRI